MSMGSQPPQDRFFRPEPISLREAWPREDQDFTPWLADNLAYLSDIGLEDLELVGKEIVVPGVGRLLDILAELPNGERVAIENQYREADHDHLTRGLAYAVGLEATTLVLIAEAHRDEFIAVADYLNRAAEHLDAQGIAVMLVTVKVEQVAGYLIPRFEVVARPNKWLSVARQSLDETGLSVGKQRRKAGRAQFWDEFLAEARRQTLPIFQGWQFHQQQAIFTAAITGKNIQWYVRVLQHSAVVELMIATDDAQLNSDLLDALRDHEDELTSRLGTLAWDPKEGALRCSVHLEPVESCGWRTPPKERVETIPTLVQRVREFYDALRGPLAAAWGEVSEQLNGDENDDDA